MPPRGRAGRPHQAPVGALAYAPHAGPACVRPPSFKRERGYSAPASRIYPPIASLWRKPSTGPRSPGARPRMRFLERAAAAPRIREGDTSRRRARGAPAAGRRVVRAGRAPARSAPAAVLVCVPRVPPGAAALARVPHGARGPRGPAGDVRRRDSLHHHRSRRVSVHSPARGALVSLARRWRSRRAARPHPGLAPPPAARTPHRRVRPRPRRARPARRIPPALNCYPAVAGRVCHPKGRSASGGRRSH